MYRFMTLVKRDMVNILKNPTLLISNLVITFVLTLILGFLSSGNYGRTGVDSYDYYGITMLIFAVLNVAMTASNSFMEKSLKTSNLRVIFSPIPKSYIYLSKIVATFAFTSVCLLLNTFLFNIVLQVNFGGARILYVIALLLLFDLFSSITGVMFCCIFKSEELSNRILSLVIDIFAILGGIFFQLDGFGDVLRKLTYISPVKWVVEAVFRIIYDNDLSLFIQPLLVLSVLSLVFLGVCKLTFKTEDYV
ncbi:MAG: ABC transporter permease [Bacillota bacterium]|nr:ABC transporter permease [Bacillota bacterium]